MGKEKKKKNTDTAAVKDEISKADNFRMMTTHINGKFSELAANGVPPFPNKYHIEQTESGNTLLLIEGEKEVVRYCSEERITGDLVKFCNGQLRDHPFFSTLIERPAKEQIAFWRLSSPNIPQPPSFRFLSDQGLCFSRMPFDPIYGTEGRNSPLFAEICSRIDVTGPAFRAFIGSIFVGDSDRQQYLYLHGQGMNGKGCVIRLLEKCLGPAYMPKEPPSKDSQHWNEGLVGKRLVVFSDIADTKFPTSAKFKMLSGDDPITINPKGKPEYKALLNCKFVFASNDLPEVSGQKSDQRRIIFCDIEDVGSESDDPNYEDKLWLEAPYIIGWCIDTYHKMCPNTSKPIPFNADVNEALADQMDGDCERMFTEYFQLDDSTYVTSGELSRIFYKAGFNGQAETKLRRFRKWLRFKHKIKSEKNEKGVRGFQGIRIHSAIEGLADHNFGG